MESFSTTADATTQPPHLVDEQVSLLYGALPGAVVGNLLIASLLAVVQWMVIAPVQIVIWLGLMVAVLTLRGLLGLAFLRRTADTSGSSVTWLWRFRWGAIATGVTWGLSGILMFPEGHLAHEVFLAFVLAGMSSGAITSLSADRWSALGFVVPALLPMVFAFFREGGTMAIAMGVMGGAYLMLISGNAIRLQRRLFENVRLRVGAVESRAQLARQQQLVEVVARAQSEFIRETDRRKAFDGLLSGVLDLTDSEYGFIGEVLYTSEGEPYLKTYAITNIAWDEPTRRFYDENAPTGMEFFNLKTLFGAALTSGEPVIANDPAHDPRSGGLPEGHPALRSFLGVPIDVGGQQVAMLGIANRPDGYSQEILDFIHPLFSTIGQLVEAARAQQRHLESERRLRGIIEGTRIGTWEWNVQTGETVFNERWAEIVGYTLDELGPTDIDTWMRLAHPDDLNVSGELLERHFSGELDYYDCQCRMRHKDGRWIWVHDRGRVVSWTSDGKPLLMAGTHADITDQKLAQNALQEQAQHTQTIVENMVDGIITIDAEGVVESFNPAAERIFGYPADEVIGNNVNMLMPAPHAQAHDTYLRNYRVTGVARVIGIGREVEGQRRDGSAFPMELAVSEITRGGRAMYLGMVRDISERKRVDRMKSEFVSTVSHELRTPLTSISGALGLVAQGAVGEIPEKVREMIDIASTNSHRLTHLINDLLDIEKLAVGKMCFDMQVQPLMPLIERAIEANRVYGAERNVTIELVDADPNVQVRVDQQRLMQVLSNLLSNAIKYSPECGVIEVSVQCRADTVRVAVVDHGHGIPAEFRTRIFQKFAQADSSDTRQTGGTGLGLAITRELLTQMGGAIDYESVKGEGTTFYFDLPVSRVGRVAGPDPLRRSEALQVLLVESDPQVQTTLARVLRETGIRFELAATGAEALQCVTHRAHEAILLDIRLPDMSGIELVRQLRDTAVDIPVVLFSALEEGWQLDINTDLSDLRWLNGPIETDHLRDFFDRLNLVVPSTDRPRVLYLEQDGVSDETLWSVLRDLADADRVHGEAEARARIALERFDIVMFDMHSADRAGWHILSDILRRQPGAEIVAVSGGVVGMDEADSLRRDLLHTRVSPRRLVDILNLSPEFADPEEVTA